MTEFSQLVDLIAVLNQADAGPGLRAVVHEEGNAESATCSVEARAEPSTYRSIKRSGRFIREVTYWADKRQTQIVVDGEMFDLRDREYRIPILAPELAMFRPLDLPMWGGSMDSHRVQSVSRIEGGDFLLEAVVLGRDGQLGETVTIQINAEYGFVVRMRWNSSEYTTSNVEISHMPNEWWPLG